MRPELFQKKKFAVVSPATKNGRNNKEKNTTLFISGLVSHPGTLARSHTHPVHSIVVHLNYDNHQLDTTNNESQSSVIMRIRHWWMMTMTNQHHSHTSTTILTIIIIIIIPTYLLSLMACSLTVAQQGLGFPIVLSIITYSAIIPYMKRVLRVLPLLPLSSSIVTTTTRQQWTHDRFILLLTLSCTLMLTLIKLWQLLQLRLLLLSHESSSSSSSSSSLSLKEQQQHHHSSSPFNNYNSDVNRDGNDDDYDDMDDIMGDMDNDDDWNMKPSASREMMNAHHPNNGSSNNNNNDNDNTSTTTTVMNGHHHHRHQHVQLAEPVFQFRKEMIEPCLKSTTQHMQQQLRQQQHHIGQQRSRQQPNMMMMNDEFVLSNLNEIVPRFEQLLLKDHHHTNDNGHDHDDHAMMDDDDEMMDDNDNDNDSGLTIQRNHHHRHHTYNDNDDNDAIDQELSDIFMGHSAGDDGDVNDDDDANDVQRSSSQSLEAGEKEEKQQQFVRHEKRPLSSSTGAIIMHWDHFHSVRETVRCIMNHRIYASILYTALSFLSMLLYHYLVRGISAESGSIQQAQSQPQQN